MVKYARESFFINIDGILDYYSTLNQKGFWKLVKKLLKDNKNTPIPPLIDPLTQQIETQDIHKANILNNYFVNVSTIDDHNVFVPNINQMCHSIIDRIPIIQDEIIDLINSLKLGKASGLDCISHQMLKKTS